ILPELGQIGISLVKNTQESAHAVDKLAEFIALRLG
ncbi:LysR family transcriptional regulator, partial [Pseudoalteromonas sp. Of11M-6]|nr:LysR family transcriptional regulator [Pseudoalteromonas sp. Of11M-6]MCG7556399.1 LysR family transcriptional regulator [Pseudoalteromonas sp. Of11M-6]MCX2768783.1 LysR family transcriptional regulator [Pseudoalteromonas sp. B530]MCX2769763.1 LysR family transcriptional regulator [Pseudoalteromonas sp. B530]